MAIGPGHKRAQHLIAGEAYRRIMAGAAPATLSEFAQELLDWLRQTYPEAWPITLEMVESDIRDTLASAPRHDSGRWLLIIASPPLGYEDTRQDAQLRSPTGIAWRLPFTAPPFVR